MSNIQLNLNKAKSIASLIALADKKVTPILGLIRCELKDNTLTAVATDRYSLVVATYEVAGPDAVFYIDTALAKFITGIKAPRYGVPAISVDIADDRVTLSYDGASIAAFTPKGTYPPVIEHVTNNWQPAEAASALTFDLTRFASYAKLIGSDGKKVEKWTMQLGQPKDGAKLAPLRFEADNLIVLGQPMMR